MNNDVTAQLLSGEMPLLNNTGINMQNLISEYKLSASYTEQYTRDFPKLDQLVDAVPISADKDVPFVGDTTLAGLVRAIPRTSLQQLPVFSARVNGTKISMLALLCSYFLKKFAFNEDTFGKGLLSTLQLAAEQALTHGYAPVLIATGLMYRDFGTRMRLLHYSDSSPEPGIQDHNETGFDYTVSHPTASRVRDIIRKAKANPSSSWNVPALQKVLENSPKPTNYSQYESSARQNQTGENAGPTYTFVTRYEVGVPNGTIITFCPELPDVPLRVMTNKSKFGYPRVNYLVIDPAALTPFGVSRVRLASPNQNLMNIYYANIAAMLLLNSAPPILKRGRFLKPVKLKRNAVWETLDNNASAQLITVDSGALGQFTSFAQQFAGQIQNIMGGQLPTLNAGTKNAFGKTGPGVKAAADVMDVNTNQITKILENFLRQYALVALDTLFAEQSGIQRIIVDDETKNQMNQLVPGFVGADNKVLVNWDAIYDMIEEWAVDIDVSLSKDELDEKKRGDLQDMLVVLAQNAQEIGPDAVDRVNEITNMLLQDKAPLIHPLPTGMTPTPQSMGVQAPTAPSPQSPSGPSLPPLMPQSV